MPKRTTNRPCYDPIVRRTIGIALLAGWIAAGAGKDAGAADGWRVFHSEEGGFQVEMPGEPVASESSEETFVGSVTNHLFTVQLPSEEFTVEYSDLPQLALVLGGPTTILKKAKEALLKDVRGEELTFRLYRKKGNERAELCYAGRPGDNPGVFGFARFFLRGDRIYVAHFMLSDGRRIDPERVERFLGSFRPD
jgi:hypothetical protein